MERSAREACSCVGLGGRDAMVRAYGTSDGCACVGVCLLV